MLNFDVAVKTRSRDFIAFISPDPQIPQTGCNLIRLELNRIDVIKLHIELMKRCDV